MSKCYIWHSPFRFVRIKKYKATGFKATGVYKGTRLSLNIDNNKVVC